MDFAKHGTLTVAVPAEAVKGDYPLLSAASFGGGNVLRWTHDIENRANLSASLYVQGGTLYLKLSAKGSVFLIR